MPALWITLNPYQGLKDYARPNYRDYITLWITLNPYQGLKVTADSFFLGIAADSLNYLESLSGIESIYSLLLRG